MAIGGVSRDTRVLGTPDDRDRSLPILPGEFSLHGDHARRVGRAWRILHTGAILTAPGRNFLRPDGRYAGTPRATPRRSPPARPWAGL